MPAIRLVALGLAGLSVAACSADIGPRELGGTVAGAPLGGLLGNRLGTALDNEDRRLAYAAQIWALEVGPSGAPVPWRNPDSGRYGNVVPGPAYELNGVPCRQYTSTMYIDGRPQTERGTACRKPDGTWMIVN
jgi:surface antigen